MLGEGGAAVSQGDNDWCSAAIPMGTTIVVAITAATTAAGAATTAPVGGGAVGGAPGASLGFTLA